MSIRTKTILVIAIVIGVLFLISYSLTYRSLLEGFLKVEEDQVVENTKRLNDSIKLNIEVLNTKTADWGRWDDAYNFMVGNAPDFEEANLELISVRNLKVNLMVYLDLAGNVVTSRLVDIKSDSEVNIPLPSDILPFIATSSPLLKHESIDHYSSGIVLLESGPMLISARPIVSSNGQGQSRGTIIFGRYIDQDMINELSSVTHLDVKIEQDLAALNETDLTISNGQDFGVVRLSEDRVAGFTFLRDINDKNILKAEVSFDRTVYKEGLRAARFFSIFYAVIALVFAAVIILILERLIIARLTVLGNKVDNIRTTRNLNQSVAMSGSDEFAKLSRNIDDMLTDLRVSQKLVGERDAEIAQELKQIEEKNETLEHTQRAVLNVLEDLEVEKRRIEEVVALRTSELKGEKAKLVASINSLPVGFAIFSPTRELLVHNESLSRILDINSPEVSFSTLKDKFGEIFDLSDGLTKVQEGGASVVQDELILGKKSIKLFLAPAKEEDGGSLAGFLLLIEDITERKMLERTREEFFAVASHELRTPLTAIRGNMSMIKDFILPSLNNKDLSEMINDSYDGAVRLINIVNDFLDSSRLEQGKVTFKNESVDIGYIVTEVLHDLEAVALNKKLTLTLEPLPDNLPKIFVDRDRVKQIIFNLVGNAVNYTRDGGVTIKVTPESKFVKVSVTDTGIGISAQNQQRLFKKFQQAQEKVLTRDMTKSTGLGLYISKMLAENMGGHITLDASEPGKGSTFSVSLPIATEGGNEV